MFFFGFGEKITPVITPAFAVLVGPLIAAPTQLSVPDNGRRTIMKPGSGRPAQRVTN
jgi:hypothetical protein